MEIIFWKIIDLLTTEEQKKIKNRKQNAENIVKKFDNPKFFINYR